MVLQIIAQLLILVLIIIMSMVLLRKKRPKNYPPGPTPLPFIGNMHQLGIKPHETFIKMREKYGNIFAIDFASFRGVVLMDVKSIREALGNDAFSGRPPFRPFKERSGGIARGVITTSGKHWNDQRRFTLKTLRDFGLGRKSMEGMIHEEIRELAEIFQKDVGKPISIKYVFNGPVLNSLWHILTGERFARDDPIFKKITYMLTRSINELDNGGAFFFFPTLSKIFPEWTGYNKSMNILMAAIDIIKETVRTHKETIQDGDPRDFIDSYLREIMETEDTKSSFYNAEGEYNLIMTLVDLFIAGAETTSTTLNWALSILAQKSETQEKLYNEIERVIGSRLPSLLDREKMPYAEALIMEVLRFSSLIPLSVFRCTIRDSEIQGYTIPKGTLVFPNLFAIMKDPKTWGDPEVFRPDRFLTADGKLNRQNESLLPFSFGKRSCLGESLARDELFLFVTTLVQKFKVDNDHSQPIPDLADYESGLTLSPKTQNLVFSER